MLVANISKGRGWVIGGVMIAPGCEAEVSITAADLEGNDDLVQVAEEVTEATPKIQLKK